MPGPEPGVASGETMTIKTALFVSGMAVILAILAPGLRAAERTAADATASVSVFEFGSRIDDSRRGGDIDLLIATDLPPAEAALRRIDLLADLWLALGERKIDVLLDDGRSDAPILRRARREGIPL